MRENNGALLHLTISLCLFTSPRHVLIRGRYKLNIDKMINYISLKGTMYYVPIKFLNNSWNTNKELYVLSIKSVRSKGRHVTMDTCQRTNCPMAHPIHPFMSKKYRGEWNQNPSQFVGIYLSIAQNTIVLVHV